MEHFELWKEALVWNPVSIAAVFADWFRHFGGEEPDLTA